MSLLQTTTGLTQQWQQLLLQQAQLQLQMQLQNANNMPNGQYQQQQPQQHIYQQQPMQVSPIPQQQGQFAMPFPQMMQQQPGQNQRGSDAAFQQNHSQIQQPAQFQLSTEDWSSRVPAQNGQAQHVPLPINPTPSPTTMNGQNQQMPCEYRVCTEMILGIPTHAPLTLPSRLCTYAVAASTSAISGSKKSEPNGNAGIDATSATTTKAHRTTT